MPAQLQREFCRDPPCQLRVWSPSFFRKKKILISNSSSSYRLDELQGNEAFGFYCKGFEKDLLGTLVNDRKLLISQVGDSHVVFYLRISNALLKIDRA